MAPLYYELINATMSILSHQKLSFQIQALSTRTIIQYSGTGKPAGDRREHGLGFTITNNLLFFFCESHTVVTIQLMTLSVHTQNGFITFSVTSLRTYSSS